MFITIIGRLVGAESSAPSPFKDTEPNTWYSPYVAWAADLGVVNGFQLVDYLGFKQLVHRH